MLLPAGTFAQNYAVDKALIRTRLQKVLFALFLVAAVVFPLIIGIRFVAMVNVMLVTLVAVVGLQLCTGYAGQINLGQSAFMGVGAFVCAALAQRGWPLLLALPAAGGVAALSGVFFGLGAIRIKGFYLALTTIAAQYIFVFAMLRLPSSWFGQARGLPIDPARLAGLEFDTEKRLYYLLLAVAALMVCGAYGIARSRMGRAFLAVRDNEEAASIIGINVHAQKMLAFLVAAFYAGVAGGLWAYSTRYVTVEQFTLWFSVWYMAMIIVGGMGSIIGAIFGTVVIRVLNEVITDVGPRLSETFPNLGASAWFAAMNVVLGVVLIAFLLREPRGLAYRWGIIKTRYRLWPFPYW